MDIAGFEKVAKYLAVPLVLVGFVLMLVFGIHDKLIQSGLLSQVSAGDSSEIIKLILHYGFQLGLCVTVLGFGLAAWSKYIDSRVQPVDAGRVAEQLYAQLDTKDQQLSTKDEQIKALTEAVTALSKTGAPAKSINDALQALEQGHTDKAKAIFAEVLKSKEAEGQKANKEAAAAARHLGTLAYMNNPKEALIAYQKAVQLDPDNADGWNQLGHLLRRTGELAQAERIFRRRLALAETDQDKRKQAAAYVNLGLVYSKRGDFEQAEQMYKKALAFEKALALKENMAGTYINLGNMYQTRGDLTLAEQMDREALARWEAIDSKEGMAVAYSSLGNKYATRGDLEQAEQMHLKALAIYKALGSKEGEALVYSNLGIIYQKRGGFDQAEQMYGKALAIDETLGHKESMAGTYANLGSVCQERGDLDQAEDLWKKSLGLFQTMQSSNAKAIQEWLDKLAQQRSTSTQ